MLNINKSEPHLKKPQQNNINKKTENKEIRRTQEKAAIPLRKRLAVDCEKLAASNTWRNLS